MVLLYTSILVGSGNTKKFCGDTREILVYDIKVMTQTTITWFASIMVSILVHFRTFKRYTTVALYPCTIFYCA